MIPWSRRVFIPTIGPGLVATTFLYVLAYPARLFIRGRRREWIHASKPSVVAGEQRHRLDLNAHRGPVVRS